MLYPRYLDNIVWELTLKCNAHCAHCASAAGIDRKDNLSEDEIMRICDELAEARCLKVTLIGGEAFLNPLWPKVVRKLRSLNIDVAIVTNALCLNTDTINFLDEQGLESLGISLDGARASTHDGIRHLKGLFDHIFSLDEQIRKSHIPTVAITTVTKTNILELPDMMKLLSGSFFDSWQLQIGHPFGRLKENTSLNAMEHYITGLFIALMQRRHKHEIEIHGMHDMGYYSDVIPNSVNIYGKNWEGCLAGKYVMGIRSNGKVTGCLSVYDDRYLDGDLREKSVSDIWNDKNFARWNKRRHRVKTLTGACQTCDYAVACCAGCSSSAIAFCGHEGELLLCYHRTEEEFKDYQGTDAYGKIMHELVCGSVTDDGYFKFADGSILNSQHPLKVDDAYIQSLLDILK